MPLPYPVIVVPGITASYLRDAYPVPPEFVWKVLRKDYARVAMHPDDVRYEAREPARVVADQVNEVAYADLIEELRFNLREKDDAPVPVYPFAYDWRQPLAETEAKLADFVEEVIARTKLLRHYHRAGYADAPKVNLVGHSMGGLVITGYLARWRRKAPVHKVATLATPFRGSFEAVLKVVTGTAELGTGAPGSREREAARLTPALYHLIPSFEHGFVPEDLPPDTLFDPAAWQPSVVRTLEGFVKRHAVRGRDAREQARALFAEMLAKARAHRARIEGFRLRDAGLKAADWLAVVGVDAKTRVCLEMKRARGGPQCVLKSADRRNEWDAREQDPARARLTGDGTVPFAGAVPAFLAERNLVCVTRKDFGYWEFGDRALSALAGFHGILPNMNMLHRMLVRFFTDARDQYGNTWGRRVPGVMEWKPPLALREK